MAPVNGYCTTAEAKARLGITDVTDDAVLDDVITAVSRQIDAYCWRRFFTSQNDEARIYTAEFAGVLFPDDVISVTTLQTDADGDGTYENTWAAADYALWPPNAALDGRSYQAIRTTQNGSYAFPTSVQDGIKVTGKFGYAAAPAMIKQACLLQVSRIFKRKDAPFGIAGTAEIMMKLSEGLDVDVQELLKPWRRMTA